MKKIYKCEICKNVAELEFDTGIPLNCCGKAMMVQNPQTADSTLEKHVPIITEKDNGYEVIVGSILHPMIDAHYILWIDLIADGILHRKYLKPNDKPKAFFEIPKAKKVSAKEYCNLHGLWKTK
ncbi:MAG: desulfoferrodoxin [Rickettsiaceae bacterium 4572_127]|nr:MAG: desulfoferrodoxin [Rickettsiaceae bacterium 4572_127]